MSDCICTVTDPKTWATYGSAVEPPSMMEPNRTALNTSPKRTPVSNATCLATTRGGARSHRR